MEEKIEKYLPIGSVCLLNGGERYVMVIGYLGVSAQDQNTVYDYMGAVYPLGVISSDISFMFNHDQVAKVIYKGFENDESKEFNKKLNEVSKEEILQQMNAKMAETAAANGIQPVGEKPIEPAAPAAPAAPVAPETNTPNVNNPAF